jgi:hypothetical protein
MVSMVRAPDPKTALFSKSPAKTMSTMLTMKPLFGPRLGPFTQKPPKVPRSDMVARSAWFYSRLGKQAVFLGGKRAC